MLASILDLNMPMNDKQTYSTSIKIMYYNIYRTCVDQHQATRLISLAVFNEIFGCADPIFLCFLLLTLKRLYCFPQVCKCHHASWPTYHSLVINISCLDLECLVLPWFYPCRLYICGLHIQRQFQIYLSGCQLFTNTWKDIWQKILLWFHGIPKFKIV